MICPTIPTPIFIFFVSGLPGILYYSHLLSLVSALVIATLVLSTAKKDLSAKIFLLFIITFIFWIISNLVTWTGNNASILMFFWSMFGVLFMLMAILSFYFFYTFCYKKDLGFLTKIILFIALLPILVFTPTKFNITNFDLTVCGVFNQGTIFTGYYYIAGLVSLISIFFFFLKDKLYKQRKNMLFVLGISIFIILFFSASYVAELSVDKGLFNDYTIEYYGIFGMTIFLSFLSYTIVKFKAFDIKLIGAQALIVSLIVLIGSQFFFIQSNINKLLTAITLIITGVIGINLIRSVKKEVALREELEIANNNQRSLIHFITHQVKGFFTKSKMVFAGLLEGDFGEVNDTVKTMAQDGLNSDNNAVSMIQDILSAANLRSGTVEYSLAETDFAELVRIIATDFKDVYCKGNLACEINIPEEKIMVMADKTQISQAIKNLIDNSIKYTPVGKISVSLRKVRLDNKVQALFEVSDTGVGLSESDKQKLFTEGGKGDESLKTNVNSTGFGLYIMKRIVEKHNGKVWAESEGRGKGSKFFISLPVKN